jgi:hypothetical protein
MSHWAEIDENNIVLRVLVGDNNDPHGDEGYQWLIDNLGGTWVKTSINTVANTHRQDRTPFRKNFAGVGYTFDEEKDAFIPPKPYPSWVLDDYTCLWKSPIPTPDGTSSLFPTYFEWDEETLSWKE